MASAPRQPDTNPPSPPFIKGGIDRGARGSARNQHLTQTEPIIYLRNPRAGSFLKISGNPLVSLLSLGSP